MFRVTINYSKGYSDKQLLILNKALLKIEQVMNSEILKENILNFTSPLGNVFVDNDGLNNQQVFEKLYSGKEHYDPVVDYEADLILVLVKKRSPWFTTRPAIGYGMPGQKEIYTYSFFLNEATEDEFAGHIAHEWAHKLGFGHDFKHTPNRSYSVPYAFGYLVEQISKQLK